MTLGHFMCTVGISCGIFEKIMSCKNSFYTRVNSFAKPYKKRKVALPHGNLPIFFVNLKSNTMKKSQCKDTADFLYVQAF